MKIIPVENDQFGSPALWVLNRSTTEKEESKEDGGEEEFAHHDTKKSQSTVGLPNDVCRFRF